MIPTDYFEKLTAHQCHVINLTKNMTTSQDKSVTKMKSFFDMLTNAAIGTQSQNQFFSKQQDMKTKNSSFLKISVMLSVLADGRELTAVVMLKGKESSRRKTT